MSTFKQKPTKLKYRSEVTTVHEKHTNIINGFNLNQISIPQKRRQIMNIKEKLNNDQNLSLTERSKLLSQIKNLEYEIFQSDDNCEILNYASKIGDYLVDYYEKTSSIYYNPENIKTNIIYEEDIKTQKNQSIDEISEINENTEKNEDIVNLSLTENIQKSSKLDELTKFHEFSKQTRKVKKPVKKRRIVQPTSSSTSILHFLSGKQTQQNNEENNQQNTENNNKNNLSNQTPNDNQQTQNEVISKSNLLHKYLMLIDKEYACGKVKAEKITYCPDCKLTKGIEIEKILFQSEGCFVCRECGHTHHAIMESELPSHKELANEKQKYPYKKINHLKEKLNQFQSKESADVPDDICATVRSDLRKMGLDPRKSTPPLIRSILKKHKWTHWYEHLQQIYCKVSGNKPITLSSETEEKIINMFQSMQDSFRLHCPKHRSNFLSYAYVLNKIFRILKMSEHAKFFALLKSKEKLREQDAIWKKICEDKGWDFYSSF